MDTIFMNSGNSKTSDPHRINLKRSNMLLYQIEVSIIHGRI